MEERVLRYGGVCFSIDFPGSGDVQQPRVPGIEVNFGLAGPENILVGQLWVRDRKLMEVVIGG